MAHGRYDLTEFEWNVIKPLLPNKVRGVPRVDDRRVLNGIFYQLRSGSRRGLMTWSMCWSERRSTISPCRPRPGRIACRFSTAGNSVLGSPTVA